MDYFLHYDNGYDPHNNGTAVMAEGNRMSSSSTLTPMWEDEFPQLTANQEIVLSLLFVFSGTLSVLGSSTIVYKVMRNFRSKTCTPYDRLMLGLSSFDIVSSFNWVMTPFLLPEDGSQQRVWAKGNDKTCNMLGFFTQIAYAAVVYNGLLSFYYLLTVRLGVKRQRFATRYEIPFHLCTIIYFVGTAISGSVIGLYSEKEVGFQCWVNDYPQGCADQGNCISQYIIWAFGVVPTLAMFAAIVINNLVIYCHVRKSLSSSPGQEDEAGSGLVLTHRQALHNHHIKEVATQGFLYVATFLVSYLPAIVIMAYENWAWPDYDEPAIYGVLIWNSLLCPLQGFMNMFVYNRPSYNRLRAAHPEMSVFQTIKTACLTKDIPKMTEISSFTRITKHSKQSKLQQQSNKSKGSKASSNKAAAFSTDLEMVREASLEEDRSSTASEDVPTSDTDFECTETMVDYSEDLRYAEGGRKPKSSANLMCSRLVGGTVGTNTATSLVSNDLEDGVSNSSVMEDVVFSNNANDDNDDDNDINSQAQDNTLEVDAKEVYREEQRRLRRMKMDGAIAKISESSK